jgi:hypothetical protein
LEEPGRKLTLRKIRSYSKFRRTRGQARTDTLETLGRTKETMQLPLDPEDIGGVTYLTILPQSAGVKDPRYDPYRLDLEGDRRPNFRFVAFRLSPTASGTETAKFGTDILLPPFLRSVDCESWFRLRRSCLGHQAFSDIRQPILRVGSDPSRSP